MGHRSELHISLQLHHSNVSGMVFIQPDCDSDSPHTMVPYYAHIVPVVTGSLHPELATELNNRFGTNRAVHFIRLAYTFN